MSGVGSASMTPIRAAAVGPLFFETWVEEGNIKQFLKASPTEVSSHVS
jgi:hypothetical protein